MQRSIYFPPLPERSQAERYSRRDRLEEREATLFSGAIVGGLFALYVGFVSHRRETQTRNAEWMRDKLFSIYSDAIYHLIKLSLSAPTNTPGNKDVRQHFSEAQRYLNLLRSYHSRNTGTTAKLQQCTQALAAVSDQTTTLVTAADSALANSQRPVPDRQPNPNRREMNLAATWQESFATRSDSDALAAL